VPGFISDSPCAHDLIRIGDEAIANEDDAKLRDYFAAAASSTEPAATSFDVEQPDWHVGGLASAQGRASFGKRRDPRCRAKSRAKAGETLGSESGGSGRSLSWRACS
jgi:hypothetical protein